MREGLAHHLLGSLPAPALRGKALLRGKNPQKLSYTWAVDPKPPRPGLRTRLIWGGVICGLLGGVGGHYSARPPRGRPPPPARRSDPEGDQLLDQALLANRIRDSRSLRATESPATQRRADEAATRTYSDGTPAPAERLAPARRPSPTRPLPLTPAPSQPPAPPRPLLFTPGRPRPIPLTPAPPPTPAPPSFFAPKITPLPPENLAPPANLAAPSTRAPPPVPAPPAPDPTVAAEVTDLTPLPDSIGNLYFIGLYHNTGEATIDLPRAELTLWSSDGQKLATVTGFTSRHHLPAGETTPIKVLFTKAPPYATMTARVAPKRELFPRHRPQLELADIQLGRDRYAGYRVTGTVHNRGPAEAQFVQVIALLYDAQEHLAGLDSRFTAQRFLPAGTSTPFEVKVSLVRGVPKRVHLDYQALEVRAGTLQSR